MIDKGSFYPYDSVHADILRFIDQRGLRESIVDRKLAELAKAEDTTPETLVENKMNEMVAQDNDLKYLIQEYHDGLLAFEIGNQRVWDKAAKDEAGLARFFKQNQRKYKWDEPRYKGMAYHVKEKTDVKAVQKAVKGLPFDQWADKLRTTFNNDSVLRIRVDKIVILPQINNNSEERFPGICFIGIVVHFRIYAVQISQIVCVNNIKTELVK